MADRLGENGAIKFAQESTADVGTVSRLAGAGQIEADIRRLVAEGFYTAKVAAYTVRGRLINAALDAISIFSPSSLFANGEVGAWYDPSDFSTLYQNSNGTTPVTAVEQPVGLMLDKSQGLVLGAEHVSNGTFDDATGWTLGAGHSISGGVLALDTTLVNQTSTIASDVVIAGGVTYRFDVDVTITTGIVGLRISTSQVNVATSGTYSIFITPTSGVSQTIGIRNAQATTVATIDNISVKELPGNHAYQATSTARPTLSARYNLLTYTEQFDNAAWTKFNVTVTANATTAPDGTTTADKLVESANTARHIIYSNFIFVAGVDYTFTIRVKAAERQYVQISGSVTATSSYANFDISSGTRTAGTVGFGTITADSNGFYLITVQFAAGGGSGNVSVDILTNSTAVRGGGSYAGDGTSGIYIWGADLRIANDGVDLPDYQRVAAATDYDTVGFLPFLSFDGTDDSMATNSIDFTGTDKMTVWTGVRKLSDAAQKVVAELSATIASNDGTFLLAAPDGADATYAFDSKGTAQTDAVTGAVYASPTTNILTGIGSISGDITSLRVNGAVIDTDTGDQGTGNYGNYPLYIGRRGGSTLPLNGRIYSLIVRGVESTDAEITNTESWVNARTGAF